MWNILVVGGGSIGERHLRCFLRLPEVSADLCDVNEELLKELKIKYAVRNTFSDWNRIDLSEYDAAVICTPAHLHIPMSKRAIESGCNVLCEKPLSIAYEGVDELIELVDETNKVFAVAYVYRVVLGLIALRDLVLSGKLGQIKQVVGHLGQFFPKFRPAYREIYYRDRKTGGGAIQDACTHMINYIEWVMGPIREVFTFADHLALDGVSVEDTVSMVFRFYKDDAIGSYSLNQFQKPNEGFIEFIGTESSARYKFADQVVEIFEPKIEKWKSVSYPIRDRDELFEKQASVFLEGLREGIAKPCTLKESAQTLRTILSALRSLETNQPQVVARVID